MLMAHIGEIEKKFIRKNNLIKFNYIFNWMLKVSFSDG